MLLLPALSNCSAASKVPPAPSEGQDHRRVCVDRWQQRPPIKKQGKLTPLFPPTLAARQPRIPVSNTALAAYCASPHTRRCTGTSGGRKIIVAAFWSQRRAVTSSSRLCGQGRGWRALVCFWPLIVCPTISIVEGHSHPCTMLQRCRHARP